MDYLAVSLLTSCQDLVIKKFSLWTIATNDCLMMIGKTKDTLFLYEKLVNTCTNNSTMYYAVSINSLVFVIKHRFMTDTQNNLKIGLELCEIM